MRTNKNLPTQYYYKIIVRMMCLALLKLAPNCVKTKAKKKKRNSNK